MPADLAPLAVSVKEAAELMGISENFLADLIAAGEFPVVRLGRRNLVRTASIDVFLAEHEEPKASA